MRRPPAIPCLLIAAAAVVAGCGGADEATAPQSTGAADATDRVEIADFKFDPETITVPAGTEVTWTNADDAAHTATADDGSFDTGTLRKGDSKTVSLDEPGTYTYYCRFHAFMKATVEVQ